MIRGSTNFIHCTTIFYSKIYIKPFVLRFVHLILVFFNGNSLLLFIRKFIRSLLESLKIQLTAVLIMVRIVISFSSISTFFTLYSYIHGVKYRKENLLNISRLLWQEKWIDETRTQFILLIRSFHLSNTFFDHFLPTYVCTCKVRSSTHSQAYQLQESSWYGNSISPFLQRKIH